MIGFELSPVKGELVYSFFARHCSMLSSRCGSTITEKLIGRTTFSNSILFPFGISEALKFSNVNNLNSKYFIRNHTALSYHSHFIPHYKMIFIRDRMKKNSNVSSKEHIINNPKYHTVKSLFYCSYCYFDDIHTSGMASWKYIHQIPGVFTCPYHQTKLLKSTVLLKDRYVLKTPSDDRVTKEEIYSDLSLLVLNRLTKIILLFSQKSFILKSERVSQISIITILNNRGYLDLSFKEHRLLVPV